MDAGDEEMVPVLGLDAEDVPVLGGKGGARLRPRLRPRVRVGGGS